MMPPATDLDVVVDHRQDLAGGIAAAVFDHDRTYRYLLTRIWDPSKAPMVWVMLNPSTADAFVEDPTVRRLIGPNGFAKKAGGIVIVNLFALRSTNPAVLRHHPDPVGRYNDVFIRQATRMGRVVAAWGAAGIEHGRGPTVAASLTSAGVSLACLGTTSTGQPRHPLYVPGSAVLERFGGVA
jgi:hypothetical protein